LTNSVVTEMESERGSFRENQLAARFIWCGNSSGLG